MQKNLKLVIAMILVLSFTAFSLLFSSCKIEKSEGGSEEALLDEIEVIDG